MNEERENAIKIAVLQEQIQGLRAQATAHAATTKEQFDKLDGKVDAKFGAMGKKVDELLAVMNRGKGAYAASLAMSGVIGAAVLSAINYVSRKVGV